MLFLKIKHSAYDPISSLETQNVLMPAVLISFDFQLDTAYIWEELPRSDVLWMCLLELFWLLIGAVGSSPMWAVLSWSRWSWAMLDSYIWAYNLPENEPASIFTPNSLTSLRDGWKSGGASWKTLSFPCNIWSECSITETEKKLEHQLSQATVGFIWLSSDRRYVENLEKVIRSKP